MLMRDRPALSNLTDGPQLLKSLWLPLAALATLPFYKQFIDPRRSLPVRAKARADTRTLRQERKETMHIKQYK